MAARLDQKTKQAESWHHIDMQWLTLCFPCMSYVEYLVKKAPTLLSMLSWERFEKIEKIQRRAVRYVCGIYEQKAPITDTQTTRMGHPWAMTLKIRRHNGL